jgi:hypothetical protein
MTNIRLRSFSVVVVAVAVAALSGCAGLTAARGKTGGPITLEVAFDQGQGAKNPEQIAQLVDWMQPDLERVLTNAGYVVVSQREPAAFQPGPDRYLLLIHVLNYHAGSKAARMFVGMGAGALTLDTSNELYSGPGQVVFRSTGGVGSSRDWNKAARKINEQVAREITDVLSH